MKMKKLINLLLVVLLILTLVACEDVEPEKVDSGKQETSTEKDATDGSKDASNKEEASKNSTFKVGDMIKMGELEFTVHDAKTDTKGTEFIKPEEGKQYIRITVTVENKGSEEDVVSSMAMFKLVDKEGTSQDFAMVDNQKGQLDGDLGAGRKMKGELVYEVSKDEKEFELEINPTLGKGIAIVSIPVQ